MRSFKSFNLKRARSPKSPNLQSPSGNFLPRNDALDQQNPLSQFYSMLKTLLEENRALIRQTRSSFQIEPRDREVFIEPPYVNSDEVKNMSNLKVWTAEVMKKTFSSAFNAYYKGDMSLQQAKIYCSENVLKNIVRLSHDYHLKKGELEEIDNYIKNKVLPYLGAKYPLTESSQVNKKLQAAVRQVDSMQSISNNYFRESPIIFNYRSSGNYNDLIMEMINYLINKLDPSNNNKKFQEFEDKMSEIFGKVEDNNWVKDQINRKIPSAGSIPCHNSRRNDSFAHSDWTRFRSSRRGSVSIGPSQQKKNEQYKAKVKEYTHYLIGRKIPQNTPLYSKSEIKSENIEIRSPQILRILTKWCEELEEKYKNNYFTNRQEGLKLQTGENISLPKNLRSKIDKKLSQQKKDIDSAMKQLFQNNYEMQACILQYQINRKGDEHIDLIEKISGKFSYKITKNLHQYIISYLNRLIHGLLKTAKDVYQTTEYDNWPSPPCLLSFTIGDLIRCKCSSKEEEILVIYKEIRRISLRQPRLLKIVRTKNRLRSATNDILINVRFKDSILCEIQLAIDSGSSSFIKCSNSFHHYLYELQRSLFGPFSELCSIWNSSDKRMSLYQQLIEEEQNQNQPKDSLGHSDECSHKMVRYQKPFICSQCQRTFYHNRYVKEHLHCKPCIYWICAKCRLDKEDSSKDKNLFVEAKELEKKCGSRISKQAEISRSGICISIQSKKSKPIQYTIITHQDIDYLLKKEGQQISEIAKFKTKQDKEQFRNNYIIFSKNEQGSQITQIYAKVKYIIPLLIKENFQKEKEAISLMSFEFSSQQSQQILQGGDKKKIRENVKSIFLNDNKMQNLPVGGSCFPNVQWLFIGANPFKSLKKIQSFKRLQKLVIENCNLNGLYSSIFLSIALQELQMTGTGNRGPEKTIFTDDGIDKLTKLKNLKISHCQILNIENVLKCSHLVNLQISKSTLKKIPQGIQALQNLKNLNLSNNFDLVDCSHIGKLSKLKVLNLSANDKLSKSLSLVNLENLEYLNISKTKIRQIIFPQKGLPNLKIINLNQSKIKKLPANFKLSTKLQKAHLKKLPNFSFQNFPSVKNLKELQFQGSPAQVSQLFTLLKGMAKQLTYLNLSSSSLPNIELDLSNFQSLEDIQLESCELNIFPKLTNSTNLKKLNLAKNKLACIPKDYFNNITDLLQLNIRENELQEIPKEMINLRNLTDFDVSNNHLASFQEDLDPNASFFSNLRKVKFDNNQLTEIPLILCYCPSLYSLSIQGNSINSIPTQISKLTKLNCLSLSGNKIQQIPQVLSQMTKLQEIHLQKNAISCIPKFIQKLTKLKNLELSFQRINLIYCDGWIMNSKEDSFKGLKNRIKQLKQPKKAEQTKPKRKEKEQKKIINIQKIERYQFS